LHSLALVVDVVVVRASSTSLSLQLSLSDSVPPSLSGRLLPSQSLSLSAYNCYNMAGCLFMAATAVHLLPRYAPPRPPPFAVPIPFLSLFFHPLSTLGKKLVILNSFCFDNTRKNNKVAV